MKNVGGIRLILAIGDTRNMKTPVIVAVIAIVLIVGCLILSSKPKNKDDKK